MSSLDAAAMSDERVAALHLAPRAVVGHSFNQFRQFVRGNFFLRDFGRNSLDGADGGLGARHSVSVPSKYNSFSFLQFGLKVWTDWTERSRVNAALRRTLGGTVFSACLS